MPPSPPRITASICQGKAGLTLLLRPKVSKERHDGYLVTGSTTKLAVRTFHCKTLPVILIFHRVGKRFMFMVNIQLMLHVQYSAADVRCRQYVMSHVCMYRVRPVTGVLFYFIPRFYFLYLSFLSAVFQVSVSWCYVMCRDCKYLFFSSSISEEVVILEGKDNDYITIHRSSDIIYHEALLSMLHLTMFSFSRIYFQ